MGANPAKGRAEHVLLTARRVARQDGIRWRDPEAYWDGTEYVVGWHEPRRLVLRCTDRLLKSSEYGNAPRIETKGDAVARILRTLEAEG